MAYAPVLRTYEQPQARPIPVNWGFGQSVAPPQPAPSYPAVDWYLLAGSGILAGYLIVKPNHRLYGVGLAIGVWYFFNKMRHSISLSVGG